MKRLGFGGALLLALASVSTSLSMMSAQTPAPRRVVAAPAPPQTFQKFCFENRLCSINTRAIDGVNSGRSENDSSASPKVNISFSTMSVTSPVAFWKRLVYSKIGVRISW